MPKKAQPTEAPVDAPIEALDWYETPHYYDIIFDPDTEAELNFLEAALERYGLSRGKRVLEPACGSGRLVQGLIKRGYTVTGTDLSKAMLKYTRARLKDAGLKARLVACDMSEAPPKGPYDLAHCFVSTFKYLQTEKAALSHLQGVCDALAPGGIYCLGFHLTDYTIDHEDLEHWEQERDGLKVTCSIRTWPPNAKRRLEPVRSSISVEENGLTRRTQTDWKFRTYNSDQFRKLLKKVPAFELVCTHDFEYDIDECFDLNDGQYDVLVVLRKRLD